MKRKTYSAKHVALINYLAGGGKYSVADLMNDLHIGDPRATIRDLREKGITVDDVWVTTATGSKYKRYWIERGKDA